MNTFAKTDGLYPPIEPYAIDTLRVSTVHTLSYEQVGAPDGRPALFLHGGPGVGIHPTYRRFFDPKRYRAVLLDQRGAGKSLPHAEIRENTTWDIVEDIEILRKHLGLENWIVMGGSWGSLLALCYAIQYPEAVAGLILRGVFLGRPWELGWVYGAHGAARIYPDEWQRFRKPVGDATDTLAAYNELLQSDNPDTAFAAASAWARWEASMNTLFPDPDTMDVLVNEHSALSIARLEAHYAINRFFLPDEDFVLKNISAIGDTPCRVIQGRYDIICPPVSAWELCQSMPNSKLTIIPNGAHAPTDPGMASALVKAANEVVEGQG